MGALYLRATFPPDATPCLDTYAGAGQPPGYREFSMIHELMHVLGFVPACSPHFTLAGHVGDSPNDLMYAGNQPWVPTTLDVGHDDYFEANVPGCLDLSQSPYLIAGGPAAAVSSGPPSTTTATTAQLTFVGGPGRVSFECALDGGVFSSCASPASYMSLSPGKHTFSVEALDSEGPGEAATYTWTVQAQCVVPNVRRLKLSAAKRKLTKANCRLGSAKRAHSAVAQGLIVSQRPAPKKHLKAKAKVSVTVSLGR